MRKVINISVPEPMERFVKCRVDNGDFGSVSEYFRYLIRTDQMSERTLTRSLGIRPPKFDRLQARLRVERNMSAERVIFKVNNVRDETGG